jgi:hypothetical protein
MNPASSTLVQPVKGSCLETMQHFSICPFRLAVASRVSNRCKTDFAAKVLDISHEGAARELCAIVGDDFVRNPETANKSFEELDG